MEEARGKGGVGLEDWFFATVYWWELGMSAEEGRGELWFGGGEV